MGEPVLAALGWLHSLAYVAVARHHHDLARHTLLFRRICRRVGINWLAHCRPAQKPTLVPTLVSPEHAGCHDGLTECG